MKLRVTVFGSSMLPTFRDGSRVVIEGVAPSELEPGEVVCWCGPRPPAVVHRFVCFENNGGTSGQIVTRGDAKPFDDPPVPESWLLGRVIAVRGPAVGHRAKQLTRAGLRALAIASLRIVRPLIRAVVLPRVRYRPGVSGDVYRNSFSRSTVDASPCSNAASYVATFRHRVVAAVSVVSRPEWGEATWEVSGAEVNPLLRGIGMGAKLIETAIKGWRATSGGRLLSVVSVNNGPATKMHQGLGFVRESDRDLEAQICGRRCIEAELLRYDG